MSATRRAPVGFLPAAGRGMRFGSSGYAKELYPLFLRPEASPPSPGAASPATSAGPRGPRPICELALRAIAQAGAERCVVVISPEKADIPRVLGSGAALGLSLAYVIQPEPLGLPHALSCAQPWLADCDVLFAMPDTVVLPADALARVQAERRRTNTTLQLGVFPTQEPERLGPVELDAAGQVVAIHDKPGHRQIRNTWGVASWGPEFTAFCCDFEQAHRAQAKERVIGHAFEAARQAGLPVGALPFAAPDGLFLDIGTPQALLEALSTLAERGILESAPGSPRTSTSQPR